MSGTLFCQWHQFLWKSLLISSLTHALQKVRIQVSKIHLLLTHKVKVTLKWKLQGMFVVRKYRNMLTKDFSQRSEIGTFKNICLKRLWKLHFFHLFISKATNSATTENPESSDWHLYVKDTWKYREKMAMWPQKAETGMIQLHFHLPHWEYLFLLVSPLYFGADNLFSSFTSPQMKRNLALG